MRGSLTNLQVPPPSHGGYSEQEYQGPLDGFCISTTGFHMTTIDQRDLDICAVQKSEEWEVLSVRSTPLTLTVVPTDYFRNTTPAVYLP